MAKTGSPRKASIPVKLSGWNNIFRYESHYHLLRRCPNCKKRQYYRKKSDTFRCTSCGTISGKLEARKLRAELQTSEKQRKLMINYDKA